MSLDNLKNHPDPDRQGMVETIVAEATPSGRAGVSIVRLSGPSAKTIVQSIAGPISRARQALLKTFKNDQGNVIDHGIVIFYEGPASFTGEDVAEFQGHGGPMVVGALIDQCLLRGARLAKPGEFSERAFLNEKMDLVQLEAVADLISSASSAAARSALKSLSGAFSLLVNDLVEAVTRLRVYVEAAIDFPDEDIEFLADPQVLDDMTELETRLLAVLEQAQQGRKLHAGFSIALIGAPNVGKSSLMNRFSGHPSAIVTEIPGTTRDVIKEELVLSGFALQLFDTAGIRVAGDAIEAEGVERTLQTYANADLNLFVFDVMDSDIREALGDTGSLQGLLVEKLDHLLGQPHSHQSALFVLNKIDQLSSLERSQLVDYFEPQNPVVAVSAETGENWGQLTESLKHLMGLQDQSETLFSARTRHVSALSEASVHLAKASENLRGAQPGELIAEDLKLAQICLGEITGKISSDELLGKIFSSFCIGK